MKKIGAVTVELALSLFSIVLVLFVALNAFSNNLNTMIPKSNMKNITAENPAKTAYTPSNVDYSESQVYVK